MGGVYVTSGKVTDKQAYQYSHISISSQSRLQRKLMNTSTVTFKVGLRLIYVLPIRYITQSTYIYVRTGGWNRDYG